MSVAPKAGEADTCATGGSTIFELLVVVTVADDGVEEATDVVGVEVGVSDVGAPDEAGIVGTDTPVDDPAVGDADPPVPEPVVTRVETVTVPPLELEVQAEVSTISPRTADTIAGRRTAFPLNI